MTETNELVVKSRTRVTKECTEQEKRFCDYILAGKTQVEACILAGYYSTEDPTDPKIRNRLRVKAKNLLNKPCVSHYLAVNKKKIYLTDDCDVTALKHHLYEIAMGRASQTVLTKDGAMEMPPLFKDQISASVAFMKFNEADRKLKLGGIQTMSDAQQMVQEARVSTILAKYKTADIVTTKFFEKHPEIEAEWEDNDEVLDVQACAEQEV